MEQQAGSRRIAGKNEFLAATAAAIIAFALMVIPFTPLGAQSTPGQAPATQPATPQWQIDAGGKMAFDVASVKPNDSDARAYSNFPLGPGDVYSSNGGLFSATNFPLVNYIFFAYKVTSNQEESLRSQLPKWVLSERFDIEAVSTPSGATHVTFSRV